MMYTAKNIKRIFLIVFLFTSIYSQSKSDYYNNLSNDSLGEAYMKNGATQLALANYRIFLDINPKNMNAAKMIDKLQSGM